MNNFVLVKCSLKDESYIIKKIIEHNISVKSSYANDEFIFYEMSLEDYEKILKYDYKKTLKIEKTYGYKHAFSVIKKEMEKILITIGIVLIIFLSKKLIISVNVHTSDKNLKRQIIYFLQDEGIKNISMRKNFYELSKIKKKILNKYSNNIEWIEIVNNGYDYNVYVIKRKENIKNGSKERCNYVANKSGVIRSIVAKKGMLMVQENNYVSSGDLLISGDIIYNDELKNEVCASGKITGEVWYKIDISYPLVEERIYHDKKSQYNISFDILENKYKLFKPKYTDEKEILSFRNSIFCIRLTKSSLTHKEKIKLSEKQAIDKALANARQKILLKVGKNSKILSENILKKSVNNDKINIEVLLTVEEEIGIVENY